MSTPEVRRPMKGYVRNNRRTKLALDVDLNVPPTETLEETTAHAGTSQTVAQGHGDISSGGSGLQAPPTIDVEAIDDEVVISSPRRFAEARKKNRRNNNVTVVFNQVSRALPVIEEDITRLYLNNYNTRSRVPPNQTIIDCEEYVNVESINNVKRQREDVKYQEPVQIIHPPPPKEPTFSCPVCMGPLVEEASTKCGHIFCKKCIKAAISAQSKCPTCRRKLTMKDVIRVYLPTTS